MSRAVQVAWLRARAVEVVPPAIIALVVLPYLINFHAEQSLPWNPATIDLAAGPDRIIRTHSWPESRAPPRIL